MLRNVKIQNKSGLQFPFHADFRDARMINEKQAIIISSFENKQDNKFAVRLKGHKREQITLTAIQKKKNRPVYVQVKPQTMPKRVLIHKDTQKAKRPQSINQMQNEKKNMEAKRRSKHEKLTSSKRIFSGMSILFPVLNSKRPSTHTHTHTLICSVDSRPSSPTRSIHF